MFEDFIYQNDPNPLDMAEQDDIQNQDSKSQNKNTNILNTVKQALSIPKLRTNHYNSDGRRFFTTTSMICFFVIYVLAIGIVLSFILIPFVGGLADNRLYDKS